MGLYSIIACSEWHDSREENFSILEAPEAHVTLQCAYADRYALVADLLLNRRPWPYYIAPFMPLATSCVIRNIPSKYNTDLTTLQTMNYLQSLVDVRYSSDFQNLYSEELEPTTEFQQVDNKNFRWESGGLLSEDTEVGFMRRGFCLSKTFYDVLDPISANFVDYVGCVNSDTVINSMGLIFTPETLLFTPPHLSRTVRFDSTNAWQINTKLLYKKPFPSDDENPGWNTFWNPDQNIHERLVRKPGAFGSTSFGGLYEQYPTLPFNGFIF